MTALHNIFQNLQHNFFESVVSNRMVYNTCWEDPRIDRELLNLDSSSEVVMLSSAGCNALDYLLDEPETIHCIDANPAQNALLELKIALYHYGSYDLLWSLLGRGSDDRFPIILKQKLAGYLSPYAVEFWERHINYFSVSSNKNSFYYRGTSGKIALMIHNRIKHKGVYNQTLKLLNARTLEEQHFYYQEVENQLWSAFYKWLIKRNTTMALLGVPASQRNLIEEQTQGGLLNFINEAMSNVFTKLPIQDNYFWRVYLTGSYTQSCCPNYLKEDNFDFYKNNVSRINVYNSYLLEFLQNNPGSYSHFVLLDHQDWLAGAKPDVLAKEWQMILENARPGAKILFRSAGKHCNFLPDFIFKHVDFKKDKTEFLHTKDRVGTYGSTHLAEVKSI
ncbi:MAG: DUF3419 family protein [Candidatus Halalkalibacterium sp. M3_1C_030]